MAHPSFFFFFVKLDLVPLGAGHSYFKEHLIGEKYMDNSSFSCKKLQNFKLDNRQLYP